MTPRPGLPLEGLDDLSNEFQQWLELVRDRYDAQTEREPLFTDLAMELIESIRLPYLLILEGPPLSGRRQLAQQIASGLGLPFRVAVEKGGRGVHYLPAATPPSERLVEAIVSDRLSLWIFERSSFGEDPPLLLALRGSFPAQRSRYVRMPRVGWPQAYEQRLTHLDFADAARVYLASGGLPGYLEELTDLMPRREVDDALPVPERVQAAFQLEVRRLSVSARVALERLSSIDGVIPEDLVDALGLSAQLPELERMGWLIFDEGWRFTSPLFRRIIWDCLGGGQRSRYLSEARRLLRDPGLPRYKSDLGELGASEVSVPGAVARTRVGIEGAPIELLPSFDEAVPTVALSRGRLWWPDVADKERPGSARFDLPDGRQLLHLSGEVHFEGRGRAGSLEVAPCRSGQLSVQLLPPTQTGPAADGSLVLRGHGTVDLWFLLPQGGPVVIRLSGEGLVVCLVLELATPAAQVETASRVVLAHDLTLEEGEQRQRQKHPAVLESRRFGLNAGGGRASVRSRSHGGAGPKAEALVTVLDHRKDQNP